MSTTTAPRPTNQPQLTHSVALLTSADSRSALVSSAQLTAIAALLKLDRAGVRT